MATDGSMADQINTGPIIQVISTDFENLSRYQIRITLATHTLLLS